MISTLFNLVIVSIFLYFLYKVVSYNKGYSIVLLLHMFFSIWMILSVVYIETGIYNRNLNTITYFNFSTFRLLVFEFIFFGTIFIWAKLTKIKDYNSKLINLKVNRNILYFSNRIIFLINLLFIFNAIISGNVLTNSNITRFNFYEVYSKIGFIRPLSYLINPLSCILGLNFIYSKTIKTKCLSMINVCLTLIYAFLTGNEFGVLFYILFYFCLPIVIYLVNSTKNKKQWIKEFLINYKKIILFIALLVSFVILVKINSFNHVNVFSEITTSPFSAFIYRALGLQGDTWWATDNLVINGYNDIGQLGNELMAIFNDSMKSEVGIQYLMKLILPQESLNRYIWGGSELMSGYPAINIAMYGYLGNVFITILDASLFFLLTSYTYKNILKKRYLRVFLSITILDQAMKVVGISGIWYLGNIIPTISMISIIFIEFINVTIGNKIIKYKKILY